MSSKITLRDANQRFAKLIREVESGREFVVTRRGQAVARIVPVARQRVLTPEQEATRQRMRKLLSKGWPLSLGRVERDDLYDR